MNPIRLHMGGTERVDGWTNINIQPGECVDIVADVRDLSAFGDGTVEEIYASHVLEHLPFTAAGEALDEWHRALRPGGRLRVAVPDIDTIMKLATLPVISVRGIYELTRFVYGGQTDAYDFHKCGFTVETLAAVLETTGFRDVRRVASFGFLVDCSEARFVGQSISLNMEATK
jgi:predicted SAM-dependent methyltransferase